MPLKAGPLFTLCLRTWSMYLATWLHEPFIQLDRIHRTRNCWVTGEVHHDNADYDLSWHIYACKRRLTTGYQVIKPPCNLLPLITDRRTSTSMRLSSDYMGVAVCRTFGSETEF